MTDTIGATIRSIHDAALRDGHDPIQAVQDYLSDKADRIVSRQYAVTMIRIHVIDYRRRESAFNEYMTETQIGHNYEEMESDL